MEFKLYVANLSAYNSGESKGEWFTLPVDMEEVYEAIFDEDELDKQGNPYGDWAIHDTDFPLPFNVGEYDSIEEWNDVIDTLQKKIDVKNIVEKRKFNELKAEDLYFIANSLAVEDVVENFIHIDDASNLLVQTLNQRDIYSVKSKLNDVVYTPSEKDEYLIYQSDENFRSVRPDEKESILKDILERFKETF